MDFNFPYLYAASGLDWILVKAMDLDAVLCRPPSVQAEEALPVRALVARTTGYWTARQILPNIGQNAGFGSHQAERC